MHWPRPAPARQVLLVRTVRNCTVDRTSGTRISDLPYERRVLVVGTVQYSTVFVVVDLAGGIWWGMVTPTRTVPVLLSWLMDPSTSAFPDDNASKHSAIGLMGIKRHGGFSSVATHRK